MSETIANLDALVAEVVAERDELRISDDLVLVRWNYSWSRPREVWDRADFLVHVRPWARHSDYSRPFVHPTSTRPLVAL